MANYTAVMARTASTTLAVGSLVSSATVRRTKLYDLLLSQAEATPADAGTRYDIQRCTAAGTSTAVTPQLLDPADGAALTACGQNHTVQPTLTANQIPLSIGLNQRATFRWVAQPGGEIVTPATSASGLAFTTPVAALVATSITAHFQEQ